MLHPSRDLYLAVATVVMAVVVIVVALLPDEEGQLSKAGKPSKQDVTAEQQVTQVEPDHVSSRKTSRAVLPDWTQKNSSTSRTAINQEQNGATNNVKIVQRENVADFKSFQQKLDEALQLTDSMERTGEFLWLGEVAAERFRSSLSELMHSLRNPKDQLEFIEGVVVGLMRQNPEEALNWADTLENNYFQNNAYVDIARVWAEQQPEDTAVWARTLRNPSLRSTVYNEIASAWARQDIDGAYEWASQITIPAFQTKAYMQIGSVWAAEDPEAAAEWSMTFRDESVRERLLGVAISKWAETDTEGAVAWIDNLLGEEEKDKATETLLKYWTMEEPQQASQWADGIAEPEPRLEALKLVAKAWAKRNPKEARKWVGQLQDGLLQENLLKIIDETVMMDKI